MSCIEVLYTKILDGKPDLSFPYVSSLRNITLHTSVGETNLILDIAKKFIIPSSRKYFASQNIISVSQVEEHGIYECIILQDICLNNIESVKEFVLLASHNVDSARGLVEEYGKFVCRCFPEIELFGVRNNLVKMYYIDVICLDNHFERLDFLTRESAERALASLLEAL